MIVFFISVFEFCQLVPASNKVCQPVAVSRVSVFHQHQRSLELSISIII